VDVGERRAFGELYHEEGAAGTLFKAEKLRDVRLIQRGQGLGFGSNRESRSGSAAKAGGSTLIATLRVPTRSPHVDDLARRPWVPAHRPNGISTCQLHWREHDVPDDVAADLGHQ
jgi:hypothetical protein